MEYAEAVMPVFRKGIAAAGISPSLWIEPGRSLVADSTLLLARVNSVKTAHRTFVNVDAGFNLNSNQQLPSNYRQFPLRFGGIRSDGQNSWDFSIVKNFPIHESFKAQFRADAYNAWNKTKLNAPNTAPTNTTFGRITGTAGDARNWQLSLKVMFC